MEFVWDENKREKVLADHKIDFAKIHSVFDDIFLIDFEDFVHSTEDEIRYGVIGKTAEYGLITLTYVVIDEQTLRFITARRAEKWIEKEYEKRRRRI